MISFGGKKKAKSGFFRQGPRQLPVKSNRALLFFAALFAVVVNILSIHFSVQRDKYGIEEQELQQEYVRLLSEVNELKGIRTKIKSDRRVELRARQLGMIDPEEPASWLVVPVPEGSLPPELKEENLMIPDLGKSQQAVSKASFWQLRARGEE